MDYEKHIDLELKPPMVEKTVGVSSDDVGVSDKAVITMRNTISAALKIITIACITDDEDVSTDFLSTFDNYREIASIATDYKLSNGRIPATEDVFNIKPIECWMELLILCFTSLFMLPKNEMIYCDNIGLTEDTETNGSEQIGICFNTVVNLEAYDWKTHSLKLFIPSDSEKHRTLFIIDDNVSLYC